MDRRAFALTCQQNSAVGTQAGSDIQINGAASRERQSCDKFIEATAVRIA